jgi:ribose transport system permease protein
VKSTLKVALPEGQGWRRRAAERPAIDVAGYARRYGLIVAFIGVVAVFAVINPGTFFTLDNFAVIVNSAYSLALISVGLTVVLIAGEFDLSIGAVGSFVGMVGTGIMVHDNQYSYVGIAAGLAIAAVIGVLIGITVTKLNVASLIATLAASTVVAGLTFWYGNGIAVYSGIPSDFTRLGGTAIWQFQGVVLIVAAFAVVVWLLVEKTDFGRRLYAVGSSPAAARMAGVNNDRTKIIAFVICSVLAGATGLLIAANSNSAAPTAADGLLLPAFTAAFLGAVVLRESEFNIGGTLIAVLLLTTIDNGLAQSGAAIYVSSIIKGILLVAAVALSGLGRRSLAR